MFYVKGFQLQMWTTYVSFILNEFIRLVLDIVLYFITKITFHIMVKMHRNAYIH